MASRADVDTMCRIAFTEGIMGMIAAQYPENYLDISHVFKLIKNVKDLCDIAYNTFDKMTDKRFQKTALKIGEFTKICGMQNEELGVFSSYLIGLLEDVVGKIKNKKKKTIIEDILKAVTAFHEYFDPEYSNLDLYKKADFAINAWDKIIKE